MSPHQQHSPLVFVDTLYCNEHPCNNAGEPTPKNRANCLIEGQVDNSFDITIDPKHVNELWDGQEEEYLSSLLCKELQEYELYDVAVLEKNPKLSSDTRVEAVEWMIKVVGHYSFSALTAVLAVNYLDRFFRKFESQTKKPWMIQLASVACLSLAAKVEETHVPLLLDLQVEESKYVFESRTIQRMELLILSTLEWKMNPVTPLSFLDYIARRVVTEEGHLCREFVRRCECLVLSLVSDCRFMSYLPSALATATALYVISSLEPCSGVEYQDQLVGILGINKDKVEECCRLIQEVATSDEFNSRNKRKLRSMPLPGSPEGVVDVCFSCDDSSSNDSLAVASVSSSPEPLSKKTKFQVS